MTATDLPVVPDYQLTPVSFLERAVRVFPDRTAVIDGDRRWTYAEFAERCRRQAGLLRARGLRPGDRVAVLDTNSHLMLEAHYGVLLAGLTLVALNTRLAPAELSYIVEHSGARVILTGHDQLDLAASLSFDSSKVEIISSDNYEATLTTTPEWTAEPRDEGDLIALNYTSGTTGRPKGVMYHGRGAYLQALAMNLHFGLGPDTRYLWTLPMFHCNGWSFTWAITASGGLHICLPKVEPQRIWELLETEGVTQLCAAPTVVASIVHHPAAHPLDQTVNIAIGGAPPTPALLQRCADLGIGITHLYGLTETFGPIVINEWRPEWDDLPAPERAGLRARQGVGNITADRVRVLDRSGADVHNDGVSVGEIALRGNTIMSGYYRDPAATAAVMIDGWFRTGDLAVLHPDGYLEIKDRLKDVIISGGENISSVEVEAALSSHPAVLEAAVVGVPDERWGERPVAWVALKDGASAEGDELRDHVRSLLAGFKVPDRVEFGDLPKTASGKIRKVELRERARP